MGQRVRKVTELGTGQVKDERIYLDGFEVYRKNGVSPLVRETLHIMDNQQRIALVDTRTQGTDAALPQVIRYQFSNHIGSASLELDHQAQIISYEEYTPYGSASYQAVRGAVEVSPKRFRFTGKERDEESGLYYHGARYFAPWLGRWTATDPIGLDDGINVYAYVLTNPIKASDPTGTQKSKPQTPNQDVTWRTDPELKRFLTAKTPEERGAILKSTDGLARKRVEASFKAYGLKYVIVKKDVPKLKIVQPEPEPKPDPMPEYGGEKTRERAVQTWSMIHKYERMGKEATLSGGGDRYRAWDPYYQAWNFAREDYRRSNLKGGDPILRNAEHYLFRKWLAHEGGTVTIPRGLPVNVPSQVNPILPMSQWFMQNVHDPIYNNVIRPDLEKHSNVAKATPEMYFFEREGFREGKRLREENPNESKELKERWIQIQVIESRIRQLRNE
jgi:RHS repeat-associated protein